MRLRKEALLPFSLIPLLLGSGAAGAAPTDGLLGSMGGLRTSLGRYGVSFAASDTETLLGNVAGGVKRGATMQGVTTLGVDVDTGAAFGLPGGVFHASALQLHGQQLSGPYLDNLQTANGTAGEDGARLWELWYDQAFDRGRFDIRIGQQSIDNEYMISANSGLFVNTMAGWPLIPSVDLYGGGPAYPLSSLGVRLRARPDRATTILAGVFDDNPGGGAFTADAQSLDASGTTFSLGTGALFIAELQYTTALAGLPGTYKLGAWYDTGAFPDQRYGTDGLSLAAAGSNGVALMHHGNYSVYGVADQTVWRSAANHARTLNLFGRIMGAPAAQNLVDFFFNGGITLTAPLPGRENDEAGIDFGIGHVSARASGLARDAGLPGRTTEELVELTYQAQVTPWLIVQPDLQFVVNPGGGVADPVHPGRKLGNELVVGVRSTVTF